MNKFLIILISFILTTSMYGQKELKKANKAYDKLEYFTAIKHYNSYLSSGKNDYDAIGKLGKAYKYTNQFEKAEATFSKLADVFNNNSVVYLEYIDMLIMNNKASEAKSQCELYINNFGKNRDIIRLNKSCDLVEKLKVNDSNYIIHKARFNSNVSDFSPIYYEDKIIYTTLQNGKKDPWTGQSFSNIFITDSEAQLSSPLKGNLNGKFHNGAASFKDNETMYFTRNNKRKGDNDDYNLLIAIAKKKGDDTWSFEDYFPFQDKNYNVAYPAISEDGQTIIFASDMPGGLGGMDLYKSINTGENWSQPINLSHVNSYRDEVFPYLDANGKLYFASNGHPGLGGLDLFSAEITNNYPPQNLGKAFNTNRDDFGLITKDDLKSGYFSSNRNNQQGIDYIYSFESKPEPVSIAGIVLDEWTKKPLKETVVTLKNLVTGELKTILTKQDGRFQFLVDKGINYKISGIKNDISTTTEHVDMKVEMKEIPYITLLHNDPRFSLEGYTRNVTSQEGVEGVDVSLFNKKNLGNDVQRTNIKGFFKFQLEQDSDFEISGIKDGFYTSVSQASTKGLNRSTTLYVKLFLNVEEVIIGDTKILGKETFGGWDFENIYYDLDKFFIRHDAALALDKVVSFMAANPNLQVQLSAHTDCRATDNYNMNLSQKRAEAAVYYVVSKGIDQSRISAKGYGESRLINGCSDNVKCSEDQHQENRRTEITIVGMKK